MCMKLSPKDLNPDLCPPHLTSIYTCGVTITSRVYSVFFFFFVYLKRYSFYISILLIRRFPISSLIFGVPKYPHANYEILYLYFNFFSYKKVKKKKKKVKTVILSHIQKERKKKKTVILTIHLYSNILFLSVFVIYLNSNTSIIYTKKHNYFFQKKKKSLPHIKTTHSYPEIFILFYFFIL